MTALLGTLRWGRTARTLGVVLLGLDQSLHLTADAATRAIEREEDAVARVGMSTGARQFALGCMAREVDAIRGDVATRRALLEELVTAERGRPLTPTESDQLRRMAHDSEQLRWQLTLLRDQFERVRADGAAQAVPH